MSCTRVGPFVQLLGVPRRVLLGPPKCVKQLPKTSRKNPTGAHVTCSWGPCNHPHIGTWPTCNPYYYLPSRFPTKVTQSPKPLTTCHHSTSHGCVGSNSNHRVPGLLAAHGRRGQRCRTRRGRRRGVILARGQGFARTCQPRKGLVSLYSRTLVPKTIAGMFWH